MSTDVGYGIASKFRIDDSEIRKFEARIRGIGQAWKSAVTDIRTGLKSAFDGPEVRRSMDALEGRIKMLGRHHAAAMRGGGIWHGPVSPWGGSLWAHTRHAAPPSPAGPLDEPGFGRMGWLAGGAAMGAGYAAYRGVAALGGAVVGGSRHALGIQREAEMARQGITAALVSMGGMGAGAAQDASGSIYRNLERAAAIGPGETTDYAFAFQRIFGPLHGRGATTGQMEKLVAQSIAGGSMLWGREGAKFGPMDIMQALTSGLTDRTTPLAKMAVEAAGFTKEQFGAASPAAQLDMLMRGFEKFAPALDVLANTVEVQEATFSDSMKRLVRSITDPAFDVYRRNLIAVNDELVNDRTALHDHASSLRTLARDTAESAAAFTRGAMEGASEGMDGVARSSENLAAAQREATGFTYALGNAFATISSGAVSWAADMGALAIRARNAPGLRWPAAALEWAFGPKPMKFNMEQDIWSGVMTEGVDPYSNLFDFVNGGRTPTGAGGSGMGGPKRVDLHITLEPIRVEGLSDQAFAVALQPALERVAERVGDAALTAGNLLPRF